MPPSRAGLADLRCHIVDLRLHDIAPVHPVVPLLEAHGLAFVQIVVIWSYFVRKRYFKIPMSTETPYGWPRRSTERSCCCYPLPVLVEILVLGQYQYLNSLILTNLAASAVCSLTLFFMFHSYPGCPAPGCWRGILLDLPLARIER